MSFWGRTTLTVGAAGSALIKGSFDFSRIRADFERSVEDDRAWERGSFEDYFSYVYGEYVTFILLEDIGVVIKSLEEDVEAFLNILDGGSGSLANSESNNLKRILDELGASPIAAAFVEDEADEYEQSYDGKCGEISVQSYPVAGCLGIGLAYSGANDRRRELYVDMVVLFESEGAAEDAADESESITRLMTRLLSGADGDIADHIGLLHTDEENVTDLDADDDIVTSTGTIKLGELLPTPTPRPTRAPTLTPAPTATPLPAPTATPAPRAQAAPAPEATLAPAASPQTSGGPGAVYRGDGDWGVLAGSAVRPEFERRFALGDSNGQVPLDAILQHQWIFEAGYYRALVDRAGLDNPTPLTSSGRDITFKLVCINRSLYWCRHLETYFVPNVAERTNGQVTIEVSSFPELRIAGPDTAGLLADGTLEMAEIYGGYILREFPSWELQYLWGLWPDDRSRFEAQAAMAPDLDRRVADEMGSQPLFRNWIADGGVFLFSHQALETPEDFAGWRVLSFGTTLPDWITGMGGEPRFMAFAEIYTALERGILHAAATGANAAYDQRWYEVADYMNGPLYNFQSSNVAVSNHVWDGIPTDLQQILIEEGARHELESLRLATIQGITAMERITGTGIQLVEFSPEVQAQSRRVAIECVIPGWLERIGHPTTGSCTGSIVSDGAANNTRGNPRLPAHPGAVCVNDRAHSIPGGLRAADTIRRGDQGRGPLQPSRRPHRGIANRVRWLGDRTAVKANLFSEDCPGQRCAVPGNEGASTMKLTRVIAGALAAALLLVLTLACGGEEPTDAEVNRKAEQVGEKAAAIVLAYGFGLGGECGDILDKHEDDIDEAMEKLEGYDGDNNSRKMSLLEDAEEKLDNLGEELEDEDCI